MHGVLPPRRCGAGRRFRCSPPDRRQRRERRRGFVDSSRYRVIQWATGNTGQRALREVIRDPALELVGVLVYSDAKAGTDAGELCGEGTTGVLATTDRDAILQLDADCCVYMPRA